jgi:hypothetical protein
VDVVFVRPDRSISTAVFAFTCVAANVYVSVFDARATDPFEGTPVAPVTLGAPAVPGGTVIVTESSSELLAVVNV